MTFHVLSMSGSLRAASANTGLVRMAQRLAPNGLVISDPYPIAGLPYYNSDLDTLETLPEVCREFREAMVAADAVLLAAPEYNFGPTAVMKNAIDWATRPMGAHSMVGKISTIVTSGGGGGGLKVQAYLEAVLGMLAGPVVTEPTIAIVKGMTLISPDGSTTDASIETLVADRLASLLAALEAR